MAFAFISCAAAFKVAKVEPKVIMNFMMMMRMRRRMIMMGMMMMETMTVQPKTWSKLYQK